MTKKTYNIEPGVRLSITVDGACAKRAADFITEGRRSALWGVHYNLQLIRRMDDDPKGYNEIRANEIRFLGPVKMVSMHDSPMESSDSVSKIVAIQTDGGIEYDVAEVA